MSITPPTEVARPPRGGLAVKLFAILLLLGVVAILVTGILGYVRGRDALEAAIYNQLTAQRQSKTRQVENYFRSTADDLRLLAQTKMVVDALRDFRHGFEAIQDKDVPVEMRRTIEQWYDEHYMPTIRHLLDKDAPVSMFLPVGPGAHYLQYHYIVANTQPMARRRLLNDAGDGSAYSAAHALFHPLLQAAAQTVGFYDLMIADARTGRIIYGMLKEEDFGTSLRIGPYRDTNLAAVLAHCASSADASKTCLEDFSAYLPSGGKPTAFMGAPIIDQGVATGVLIAQMPIDEIDDTVTGGRRWRQEGFGATGEAYLVGPDFTLRSGPRLYYENREAYFAALRETGHTKEEIAAIERFGTPIMQEKIATTATRAALSGVEGTGEVTGHFGRSTLASWGPLDIQGVRWGLVAKIETSEAFAPIYDLRRDLTIAGGLALLIVSMVGGWLSHSLMSPLRELTAGVRRFANGDRNARVHVHTRDEIGQLCDAFNGMVSEITAQSAVIEAKNRENEALLLNVLPAPIANRLRGGEQSIADGFANVTVLFADLVGFTELASTMPPQNVVDLLNGLFTRFDLAAHEVGIEKIKTVGDAYMAVCGLPQPVDDHSDRMVRMAIRMVHITHEHALEHRVSLQVRIGINSGPVVAGIIGKSKYIYDLWGDTVNLASRMEATGLPGAIQVTRPVFETLRDKYAFEARGEIEVKGKGHVEAWLLRI